MLGQRVVDALANASGKSRRPAHAYNGNFDIYTFKEYSL
jgi:hypothetical protein